MLEPKAGTTILLVSVKGSSISVGSVLVFVGKGPLDSKLAQNAVIWFLTS